MKAENGVLLQWIPRGYNMELGWEYDNMISCAEVVSVSASYSRYHNLIFSFLFPHALWLIYLMDYLLFYHVLLVYIV